MRKKKFIYMEVNALDMLFKQMVDPVVYMSTVSTKKGEYKFDTSCRGNKVFNYGNWLGEL